MLSQQFVQPIRFSRLLHGLSDRWCRWLIAIGSAVVLTSCGGNDGGQSTEPSGNTFSLSASLIDTSGSDSAQKEVGNNLISLNANWQNWNGTASGITYDRNADALLIPAPTVGQDMAIGVQRFVQPLVAGRQYTLTTSSDNAQAGAVIYLFGENGQVIPTAGTQTANLARPGSPVVFMAPQGVAGFYIQVQNSYRADSATSVNAQLIDNEGGSGIASGEELVDLDGPWPTWTGARSGIFFDPQVNELFVPSASRPSGFRGSTRTGVRRLAKPLVAGQTYEFRTTTSTPDGAIARASLFLAGDAGQFIQFSGIEGGGSQPWLLAQPGFVRRFVAPANITGFAIQVQLSDSTSDATLRPSLRKLSAEDLACLPTFGNRVFERITGSSGEEPNGYSAEPSISADGRYVAFSSTATNLVSEPDNNQRDDEDIFLYDRQTGEVRRVSKGGGGFSYSISPAISADGRFVAYVSASYQEIDGEQDANTIIGDIFLWDRTTNTRSRVTSGAGNGESVNPSVSANGDFVVYQSRDTGVIAGENDANLDAPDIFLFSRLTGTTTRITDGITRGGAQSPVISANGRYIAYVRGAESATSAQRFRTVMVLDRQTGALAAVPTPEGEFSSNLLTTGAFGADPVRLAYSGIRLPNASARSSNAYLYDVGDTVLNFPFVWPVGSLGPNTGNDGVRRFISINGQQPASPGNFAPALSPSGRHMVYASSLRDPSVPEPETSSAKWFLNRYDTQTGENNSIFPTRPAGALVTQGRGIGVSSTRVVSAAVSNDADVIAFASTASNLIPNDFNYTHDIFLFAQDSQCN